MTKKIDIEKIAQIACVDLSEEEKMYLEKDCEKILDYFEEIDLFKIPKFKARKEEAVQKAREDIVEAGLDGEEIFQEGIQKEDGYFVGPKML